MFTGYGGFSDSEITSPIIFPGSASNTSFVKTGITGKSGIGSHKETGFSCVKYPVSGTGQAKAGLFKPGRTSKQKN